MTERERLVELLKNSHLSINSNHLANYLLQSGVIVPPCKVGDTVFGIDFKSCEECERQESRSAEWIEINDEKRKYQCSYCKCFAAKAVKQFPNRRVAHLALNAKKERTRKKNINRIIK